MRSLATKSYFLIYLILFSSLSSIHGAEEAAKKNKFREREATDDALAYPEM